ncbi:MAG: YceI family protein [Verrucomicrobia bacterium]|nr:YceI family protein [Verrucomicrobiota bacterium]
MTTSLAGILTLVVLGGGLSSGQAQSEANGTYKIDPVHSSIVFRIKHNGVSYVYGRFNEFSGGFTINSEDPSKCSFDVTVQTGSVDTSIAKRDEHLRSPDFFNAKQFLTLRFQSRKVERTGESKLRVTGDLTLHGVTKPITVELELTGHGQRGQRFGYRAGIGGQFTIARADFGMNFGIEGGMLGNEVTVSLGLQGARQ